MNLTLTSSDVVTCLEEVSKRYHVNRWTYRNVCIWPVFCKEVMNYLLYVPVVHNVSPGTKFDQIQRIITGIGHLVKIFGTRRGCKYLILDHSFMATQLCGQSVRKYFAMTLEGIKPRDVLIFEKPGVLENDAFGESTLPLDVIRSTFGLAKLVKRQSVTFEYENEIRLAIKEIYSKSQTAYPFSLETLKNKMADIEIYKYLFSSIIDWVQPEEIYLTFHYIAPGYALAWAASERGCKTVEFQHGNIVNYPPYCCFFNPPEDGYALLPNEFRAWNKQSYEVYQKWAQKTSRHSAVISGNEWHAYCKENANISQDDMLGEHYDSALPTVLITLVPEVEPAPEGILQAIRETRGKFNWLVRLHPRQLDSMEAICKQYEQSGGDKVIVQEATALPLPIVLNYTDVHITSWSSCAIDAYEYAAIPTICIDKEGADRYQSQIPETHLSHFTSGMGRDLEQEISELLYKNTINM